MKTRKFRHNNCTYGFELEGVFSNDLVKKLDNTDLTVDVKDDGSISYGRIVEKFNLADDDITSEDEVEISMGIFPNYIKLLKALALFENGKNYWQDDKCGLHLHVKPKRSYKEMEELFWDLKFIKELEKFAFSELCPCVKKRDNNSYCYRYGNFAKFYNDYTYKEKYRFARRHDDYDTIEFRFLAPCEHKVDNVKKFLDFMFKGLGQQKHSKTAILTIRDEPTEIKHRVAFKIESANTTNNTKLTIF